MRTQFTETARTYGKLFSSLLRWIAYAVVIGITVGLLAGCFAKLLTAATEFRTAHRWLIYALPLAGLAIIAMYKLAGQEKNSGTNLVINVIRSDRNAVPGRVAPLIIVSSLITHLFGGSAGREGAALQFGASFGDWFGRTIMVDESDRKIITLASMSAAFSALLGTPMAAALFPMEMVSVGVMYYSALVPCVFASFIAQEIAIRLGVRVLTNPYPVTDTPSFYSLDGLKVILLAVVFALAGALFCEMLRLAEQFYETYFENRYLRIFVGGALVVILYLIVGTDAYLGLGDGVIKTSFAKASGGEMFLLKMIFTCLTICAGFKGGEIVPTFFIGATLGSALSGIFGLPVALCAACGMVGVFCAVTNSPVTSMLIAFELFGGDGMFFYCIVCAICYLLSGYRGLYKEQKIVYSKTENKYINRRSGD